MIKYLYDAYGENIEILAGSGINAGNAKKCLIIQELSSFIAHVKIGIQTPLQVVMKSILVITVMIMRL